MVNSGSKAGSVGAGLRVSGFGFEFGFEFERLTDSWQIASGPTSVVRLDFGQRSSAEPVTIPTLQANLRKDFLDWFS